MIIAVLDTNTATSSVLQSRAMPNRAASVVAKKHQGALLMRPSESVGADRYSFAGRVKR